MSRYEIEEHKHRFAAWAASRAASTSPKCRFSVFEGRKIIEAAGLHDLVCAPAELPKTANEMDDAHMEWRELAITKAKGLNKSGFSHGVAAKLINVYLKSVFVFSGDEEHKAFIKVLHPPIDRLLLEEIKKEHRDEFRKAFGSLAIPSWSEFDENKYDNAIKLIRNINDAEELWMIEKYWRGHQ